MESFKDFGIKLCIYSCLNDSMNMCEYERSRSLFGHDPELFNVDNLNISTKATRPELKPNFM